MMMDHGKIQGIGGFHKVYETQRRERQAQASGDAEKTKGLFESEELQLSQGNMLKDMLLASSAIPEVRQDLVDRFREAIENGTYSPDISAVARKLLEE